MAFSTACASVVLAQVLPPLADQACAAHAGKGYSALKDENYSAAAAEFRSALAACPGNTRIRYQYAVAEFAIGERQQARAQFAQLAGGEADPSVIYYRARIDLVDGRVDDAIHEFTAISNDPPFSDTAYYLGSAYLRKGEPMQAVAWLERATKAEPYDARIFDHLGHAYLKSGDSARAKASFARADDLRRRTQDASRDALLCSQQLRIGPEKATACSALHQPDDPDKLTTLALLYGERGYFALALPLLERAAELDRDSYEIQHDLGLTYFRLARWRDASAALERAVALRPDFFDSTALLGAALYRLDKLIEAFVILQRAWQLKPGDPDTRDVLLSCALKLAQQSFAAAQWQQCVTYLRVAEGLSPGSAAIHLHLADAYQRMGDLETARQQQLKARELSASRR